jgi:hypothetical protein
LRPAALKHVRKERGSRTSGSLHSRGVLAIIVVGSSANASGRLSTKLLLDDFEGVLLGLLRGVGVAEVGLVAANDVTDVRHFERSVEC